MLGSTIYYRALDYYEQGYIQEYKQMEGRIIATVKGSNIYPYHVELSFNKDGHIASAYCNCPYDRLCKHIGAVLIHASHLEEPQDLKGGKRDVEFTGEVLEMSLALAQSISRVLKMTSIIT